MVILGLGSISISKEQRIRNYIIKITFQWSNFPNFLENVVTTSQYLVDAGVSPKQYGTKFDVHPGFFGRQLFSLYGTTAFFFLVNFSGSRTM